MPRRIPWPAAFAWGLTALVTAWLAVPPAFATKQRPPEPPPPASERVYDWLEREHALLRRYLALVRQGAHDYQYKYKTPELLLPVTVDLFTGYFAHIHAMEERFLYPVLKPRLSAEQEKILRLVVHDQEGAAQAIRLLQQQLDVQQPEAAAQTIAEICDNLARMINRHIVFHEERFYPVLETLTPKEQAEILKGIAGYEQEVFGAAGRQRYGQLLAYIEEEIKRLAGRVW